MDKIIPIKKRTQYFMFQLEIFRGKLPFLYEIKCNITNIVKINTGILWEFKYVIVSKIWKSKKMYFWIEYVMDSVSETLNGIHARNTKYCVTKIERINPIFVLKKGWDVIEGNLLDKILWIAKYEPCNNPQTTKFQAAPCHKPPKNITISRFRYVLDLDFLLPPNGI